MNHPLRCSCGTLKGYVIDSKRANRCVCYCRDCQAFAHFLGRGAEVLDAQAGTEIIHTSPANVVFTQGQEALGCMRLTENGLLRWYATCCGTPIGNTLANYKISFVGLVHTCLKSSGESMGDAFGPIRMWVSTKSAKQPVNPRTFAALLGMTRVMAMLARSRLDGSYKRTPFFSVATGTPTVIPKVLSRAERERLSSLL